MKCEICNNRIRFWQGRLVTSGDKRNVHTECFADEAFVNRIANTLDNMAKIKANSPV